MFVARQQDGTIYGIWTVRQWDGQEELPDDHADVIAFGQPSERDVIKKKLAEIDRLTGSVRWIRELALGCDEAWTILRAGAAPELPMPGSGMAKVRAIEEQCAALRAQLAALP
jgi:hypothetical protein